MDSYKGIIVSSYFLHYLERHSRKRKEKNRNGGKKTWAPENLMVNSSSVVIIIILSKFKSAFPPSQLGSEKFPPDSELPKSLSLASQLLNNFTIFSRHCLPPASPRRGRFLLDGTWRLGSSSPPRPEAINHKPIPERHQHLKKSENVYTGKRSRRSWTVIHFTSWGGRDGCLLGCIVRRVTHASPPTTGRELKES